MKKRTSIPFLYTTLSLFMLCACTVEDGEDGAMGPQGEPGTANVIYSEWIDSGFPTSTPDPLLNFLIDKPPLTQDIIDKGVILVYGRSTPTLQGTAVYALPIALELATTQTYTYQIDETGFLRIAVFGNGGSVGSPFLRTFRYVLIPGGVPTTGKSSLDYTKMSYQEIIERFNIPQ